jgi:hypothetical protein
MLTKTLAERVRLGRERSLGAVCDRLALRPNARRTRQMSSERKSGSARRMFPAYRLSSWGSRKVAVGDG